MFKQLAAIAAVGVVQLGLWLAMVRVGPLREFTTEFLALFFALFATCLLSFWCLPLRSRPAVLVVLGFALLFRITLVPAEPYQSEDVYRYIWDARLAAHGVSPFAFAPRDPQLERFRDERVYPQVNSKPYVTAYPPVSQLLFRLSLLLFGESVTGMKLIFSLLEYASVLLAWRLLLLFGQPLQGLYLIAWNPFFIFEFSHSGHSDSAMVFFALLAFYLIARGRKSAAVASYAIAVLSKLHPALWFPLFVRRASWKSVPAGLVVGSALLLLYFTPSGLARYVESLKLYYRLFEFNAGIHYLLRWFGRLAYQQDWDQFTGPYLAVALVLVSGLVWWRFPVKDERDLMHAAFWIMTTDLCLATTVHPWYLSWAAFALPFFPYAFMLYWTGAAMLSYMAYSYRPVHEPSWVLLLEYLPMYGLMVWEIRRRAPLLSGWQSRREWIRNGLPAVTP